MPKYKRTNSEDKNFQKLVIQLDADLKIRDGDENVFYAQFNKIDKINFVIIAYENEIAVGCGAIKEYAHNTMEVKRMYVVPDKRGQGIASNILKELEKWSEELSCNICLLETGKKQPEAIELYRKNEYQLIPNYGQYVHVENSVCFKKILVN